ncbi:unnamed protein product [Calypogeia fissa]
MAAEPEQLPEFVDPLANIAHHGRVIPGSEPSRQAHAKLLEGKSESELKWWSKDTVAVVTGSNKGLGFEIVRRLAKNGITTILTSRDEGRGIEAVNELKSQGLDNVLFHPLDVTNPDSAAKLASWIKETVGGIDLLVCNAGIGSIDFNYETAKRIIDTNYFGSRIIVSALLPLVNPSLAGARILFVGSECGQLEVLNSEQLKQQLSDIDQLTEGDVDSLARQYLEDVKAGSHWTDQYFPQYNESKVLLHAYSRVLAKGLSSRPEGNKIYVNACTPGFTSTDIVGRHPGARSVEEGGDTPIWILLYPSGGPTGGFFKDRADLSF